MASRRFKYLIYSFKRKGLLGGFNLIRYFYSSNINNSLWVDPNISLIEIEPTIRCNLHCEMCPTYRLLDMKKILKEKRGNMTFKQFKKIIDQFPYVVGLKLVGGGEPMINPEIFEMVKYAKSKNIVVGFSTNATLLTPKNNEKLLDLNIDWINFSLDSVNREDYKEIRGLDLFDKVVSNITDYVTRMKRKKKKTLLEITMTCMYKNLPQIFDMVKLSKKIGINKILVKIIFLPYNVEKKESVYKEHELIKKNKNKVKNLLRDAKSYAKSLGVNIRLSMGPLNNPNKQCRWLWTRPYVTNEGFITPCCRCYNAEEIGLGNILKEPFEKVWNNEKYQALRKAILRYEKPFFCEGCGSWKNKD